MTRQILYTVFLLSVFSFSGNILLGQSGMGQSGLGQSGLGQSGVKKDWQIKTNLTGFLSNTISFELERSLQEKLALTARFGVIANVLQPRGENFFEGYFIQVGSKFYLGKAKGFQSGWAIQPKLHYSHWRDYDSNLRGSVGNRWENSFGALLATSYSYHLGKNLVIEPFASIGYIPTWENTIYVDDIEPFETIEIKWKKVTTPERRSSYFSHFSIRGDLVFSAGVLFGVRF